jgi:hypothetical protein
VSDVATEMDELRIALGEVNILAAVTADAYDSDDWDQSDPDIAEGIASLLGLIKKSAMAAMSAFHRLHGAVADAAPAVAGEAFDYSDGTAPGADAMSACDVVIVKHLRDRCPDNRFEGSSDLELIQLFRRNKRVIARSDEDVIAAMTHPR